VENKENKEKISVGSAAGGSEFEWTNQRRLRS